MSPARHERVWLVTSALVGAHSGTVQLAEGPARSDAAREAHGVREAAGASDRTASWHSARAVEGRAAEGRAACHGGGLGAQAIRSRATRAPHCRGVHGRSLTFHDVGEHEEVMRLCLRVHRRLQRHARRARVTHQPAARGGARAGGTPDPRGESAPLRGGGGQSAAAARDRRHAAAAARCPPVGGAQPGRAAALHDHLELALGLRAIRDHALLPRYGHAMLRVDVCERLQLLADGAVLQTVEASARARTGTPVGWLRGGGRERARAVRPGSDTGWRRRRGTRQSEGAGAHLHSRKCECIFFILLQCGTGHVGFKQPAACTSTAAAATSSRCCCCCCCVAPAVPGAPAEGSCAAFGTPGTLGTPGTFALPREETSGALAAEDCASAPKLACSAPLTPELDAPASSAPATALPCSFACDVWAWESVAPEGSPVACWPAAEVLAAAVEAAVRFEGGGSSGQDSVPWPLSVTSATLAAVAEGAPFAVERGMLGPSATGAAVEDCATLALSP